MMTLELRFTPSQQRLEARLAHRRYLTRLHEEGHLLGAGPWSDDTGALLIFDTDRTELDRIIAADPYYRTPGVEVVSIREWTPVVTR